MRVLHLGPAWSVGDRFSTDDWSGSASWNARHSGAFQKLLGDPPDPIMRAHPVIVGYVQQLHSLLQTAGTAAENLKEYIFELVRREEFSDHPSRWRCIYTLPEGCADEHGIEMLAKMGFVGPVAAGRTLMELELEGGSAHRCSSAHLNCNGVPPSKMEDAARAYWTGAGDTDELLYEGAFRVVRVVRRL